MAAPSPRAFAVALVGAALAGCGGKTGPEDPAVAIGTGIPMGAASATGVSFESSRPRSDSMGAVNGDIEDPPKPLPKALPPDPFQPHPPPSASPPPIKAPKKRGTAL